LSRLFIERALYHLQESLLLDRLLQKIKHPLLMASTAMGMLACPVSRISGR
jgi:hypothetical protein